MKPEYKAGWEKEPGGKVTGNLKINFDSPEAWTLFSLSEGNFVSSGYHYLPLFRGDIAGCLHHLQTRGYSREILQVLQHSRRRR